MPLQLASLSPFEGFALTLYARVSKDQRGGRSVAQQLKRGRRWGADNGCVIVGEFSDNDQSASRYASRTREEWPKVEEQIQAGKSRILWIYEISRGTRDLEVWARLARVCREQKVYIVLDDDVYDSTKPSHMRQLNQLMVDAVYESDKTAARINRDASEMADEGHPWGYAGFGFKREYDPSTGELIRQVPDEEQAAELRSIIDDVFAGKGLYSIARDLNRRGLPGPSGIKAGDVRVGKDGVEYVARGWTHESLRKLLTRPALMGKRVHHGKIITVGGWEPIIDEATWQLLKSKITGLQKSRNASVKHLLSGRAICDLCGARIYTVVQKDRPRAYRCVGMYDGAVRGCVLRAVHRLDAHVEELLFERFSDPDVIAAFEQADGDQGAAASAQLRLAAASEELEQLYRDVAAGELSARMAKAEEARLQGIVAEARLSAVPSIVDPMVDALVVGDPESVWAGWDLMQRREALRATTEEIRVLKTLKRGRQKLFAEESVKILWKGVEA